MGFKRPRTVMGELPSVCSSDTWLRKCTQHIDQCLTIFDHGILGEEYNEIVFVGKLVNGFLAGTTVIKRARIDPVEYESMLHGDDITTVSRGRVNDYDPSGVGRDRLIQSLGGLAPARSAVTNRYNDPRLFE